MFKKIWAGIKAVAGFFDGGKMTIGSLILAAAPQLPDDWQIYAQIIGSSLTGGGAVHKIKKFRAKRKQPPK